MNKELVRIFMDCYGELPRSKALELTKLLPFIELALNRGNSLEASSVRFQLGAFDIEFDFRCPPATPIAKRLAYSISLKHAFADRIDWSCVARPYIRLGALDYYQLAFNGHIFCEVDEGTLAWLLTLLVREDYEALFANKYFALSQNEKYAMIAQIAPDIVKFECDLALDAIDSHANSFFGLDTCTALSARYAPRQDVDRLQLGLLAKTGNFVKLNFSRKLRSDALSCDSLVVEFSREALASRFNLMALQEAFCVPTKLLDLGAGDWHKLKVEFDCLHCDVSKATSLIMSNGIDRSYTLDNCQLPLALSAQHLALTHYLLDLKRLEF